MLLAVWTPEAPGSCGGGACCVCIAMVACLRSCNSCSILSILSHLSASCLSFFSLSSLSPLSLLPLPSLLLSPGFVLSRSLLSCLVLLHAVASLALERSPPNPTLLCFHFPPLAPAPSVRRGLAPDFAAEVEHSHLSSFDALSPFAAAPLSIISGIWISSVKQLHKNTRTSIRAMQRSLVQLHADGHTYLCNRS